VGDNFTASRPFVHDLQWGSHSWGCNGLHRHNWCNSAVRRSRAIFQCSNIRKRNADSTSNCRVRYREKGAAEANARALEAQLALEKFKAPRVLTGEHVQQIVDKLKEYVGPEFQIVTYWDMKEPLAFANQIYTPLVRAGWKYIELEKAAFMLGGNEGVQLWRHPDSDDRVQKAADALVTALNDADVTAVLKLQNSANPIDNKINLNIGTKP
jgi:hypothetical protein